MIKIIDLAINDLKQLFRDWRIVFFLFAMPIAFTFFMGFAYSRGGNSGTDDPRIALGWVDQDPGGTLSTQLYDLLASSDSIHLVALDPTQSQEAIRKGDVAGVLVVPAGFSQGLAGEPLPLTLLADLNTAQGQSLFQLLRSPVTRLMSSAEIARLSAETIGKASDPAELSSGFASAVQAYSEADNAALIKVEKAVAESEGEWYGDNPYNQASPGILLQFAIFGLIMSGQILVQERKTRTLQRMMTTTMRPWQVLAGHSLAMFCVGFSQTLLLIIFGQLALGVDYARQPLAVLLISICLGLWVTAMGMVIGVFARDDSQVVLFSLLAMFIFSALGGSWMPIEVTTQGFVALARLTPSYWAMNGYQNILIRGLGLESALAPSGILLAATLAFFVVAVWGFRRLASR